MTTDREAELKACIAWFHIVEPGDGLANELVDSMGAPGALAAILDPDQRSNVESCLVKSFTEKEVAIEA